MLYPSYLQNITIEEQSDLILEGVIGSSSRGNFPGMERSITGEYWSFKSQPHIVYANNTGERIYTEHTNIGFWTLPGDEVPSINTRIRVALTCFGDLEKSSVLYPISLWELDEDNIGKKQKRDLMDTCDGHFADKRSDLVIKYGVRSDLFDPFTQGVTQQCLDKWMSAYEGSIPMRLEVVPLTPPNYPEKHHYEIYLVEEIPGGRAIARTFPNGSIENPQPIWFNGKYEYFFDHVSGQFKENEGKFFYNRVLIHEVGHTLHLPHLCGDKEAIMSPGIEAVPTNPSSAAQPPSLRLWMREDFTDTDIKLLNDMYANE